MAEAATKEQQQSSSGVVNIDPAPDDGVTSVRFNHDSTSLLFSTWAGSLRIHSSTTGTLLSEAKPHACALLCASWTSSDNGILAGTLDGKLLYSAVRESTLSAYECVGVHSSGSAIRCVLPSPPSGSASLTATGGWDGHVRLWDVKSEAAVASLSVGGKVFGGSTCGPNGFVFITSERHVVILDTRKPSELLHDRPAGVFHYQLRSVSSPPDGKSYVVGGTDGRVAIDYFDMQPTFSFRCHRVDGLAFPVNCVRHSARTGAFATGGGDGHIAIWDGAARKRIAQFSRYPTSIADIDFSNDSRSMAVAVSYTFEDGEKDHPPDEVLVRPLEEAHIATKKSKQEQ